MKLKNIELKESNTALRVFLKQSKEDKENLADTVLANVKELVEPYLKKLKKSKLDATQEIYLDIIDSNMTDIFSPFLRQMTSKYSPLTPREIQVAILVKEGRTTKEIAKLLKVSTKAIEFYRQGLRRKLGLKSRKENLRSNLISLRQP